MLFLCYFTNQKCRRDNGVYSLPILGGHQNKDVLIIGHQDCSTYYFCSPSPISLGIDSCQQTTHQNKGIQQKGEALNATKATGTFLELVISGQVSFKDFQSWYIEQVKSGLSPNQLGTFQHIFSSHV